MLTTTTLLCSAEAMRLFPAADTLRRKCVKACTLEPKTIPGKPVHLYPGALVYVSVDAVHRDPTLYEQPDAFRPDHFSEEECSRRPKCTFLSFGEGPRMCVGALSDRDGSLWRTRRGVDFSH